MTANKPGLTLFDIAGAREQVPFGDGFLEVRGVSIQNALAILQRFPSLAAAAQNFKLTDLLVVAPGALSAVIAAGVGQFNNPTVEAQAEELPIELQFDIIEAIGRLTFKNGFGPFIQRVMALAEKANLSPSIKVTSTNSQATSKNSSPTAIVPPMSSATPPDKSPPTSSSQPSVSEESAIAT